MNFPFSESSVQISRSLNEGVLSRAGEAARAALDAFKAAWHRPPAQMNQASALHAMTEIDERTLKDIGAPYWLIARAIERKDARELRLLELYRS